jgi:ABC-type antimicrobial peptide transport system permease subunit
VRASSQDSLVFREIVGIVNDVRAEALDESPQMVVYIPHAQNGSGSVTFVASVDRGSTVTPDDISRAIWAVDPGQTVYHTSTLKSLVGSTVAERRFQLLILGTFSAVGLLLALIGVYGVIAFVVRMRMREFGLRLAIGASPRGIVRGVLRDAIKLSGAGIIVGIIGALVLTRSLRQMLYNVDPADTPTYVQTALIMLVAAVLAAFIPARRAGAAHPLRVLRED